MLTFYDANDTLGNASIYESHITFNKPMLKYLENAYRVRVGADNESNKIFIFLYSMDRAKSGEINESSLLPLSISKTYARVCSRGMIEYLCDIFKLEIPKKSFLRFKARYDEAKRCIIIDLKEES